MNTGPDLRGWLPVIISKGPAGPVVEWCRLGTRRESPGMQPRGFIFHTTR